MRRHDNTVAGLLGSRDPAPGGGHGKEEGEEKKATKGSARKSAQAPQEAAARCCRPEEGQGRGRVLSPIQQAALKSQLQKPTLQPTFAPYVPVQPGLAESTPVLAPLRTAGPCEPRAADLDALGAARASADPGWRSCKPCWSCDGIDAEDCTAFWAGLPRSLHGPHRRGPWARAAQRRRIRPRGGSCRATSASATGSSPDPHRRTTTLATSSGCASTRRPSVSIQVATLPRAGAVVSSIAGPRRLPPRGRPWWTHHRRRPDRRLAGAGPGVSSARLPGVRIVFGGANCQRVMGAALHQAHSRAWTPSSAVRPSACCPTSCTTSLAGRPGAARSPGCAAATASARSPSRQSRDPVARRRPAAGLQRLLLRLAASCPPPPRSVLA